MYNETLGKIHFWLMLIGFNVTFFPMHWVGVQGMPRRIFTYDEGYGWDFWNALETFGAIITAVSFLVFLVNAWMSLTTGEDAPDDPWDAPTLEWSMSSPPPVYNFATVPVVTSRIPLWSAKYPDVYGGDDHGVHGVEQPAVADEHAREHHVPGTHAESHDHVEDHGHHDEIHMPNPSIWPLLAALGITLAMGGFIATTPSLRDLIEVDLGIDLSVFGIIPQNIVTFVGLTLAVTSIYAWVLQPAFGHGTVHDDDASYSAAGAAGD
jgi:cytochrome c oxidase subunit I